MSDNATNLTLNLSQTLSFQDGSTATAYDLAATLNWIVTNTLPSSPIFPILKTMRAIAEVNPYTVRITLSQSNYFGAYQIGNLFAVPASSLPQENGPLALLLSGALQSSGPFELVRFVQGAEVDLQSAGRLGGAGLPTVSGVQGQIVFGSLVGGSQVQITSQQLAYDGQPVENATYTLNVYGGNSTTEIAGTYAGFGVYRATLNLNSESIPLGNHVVMSELYGQLPAGVIIQFEQENLVVHPPLFLGQVTVYLLAIVALALASYGASHGKRRKAVRRAVRRVRRKTATRSRRRR
jgi:ABC-type transport system substrate-binding protein